MLMLHLGVPLFCLSFLSFVFAFVDLFLFCRFVFVGLCFIVSCWFVLLVLCFRCFGFVGAGVCCCCRFSLLVIVLSVPCYL